MNEWWTKRQGFVICNKLFFVKSVQIWSLLWNVCSLLTKAKQKQCLVLLSSLSPNRLNSPESCLMLSNTWVNRNNANEHPRKNTVISCSDYRRYRWYFNSYLKQTTTTKKFNGFNHQERLNRKIEVILYIRSVSHSTTPGDQAVCRKLGRWRYGGESPRHARHEENTLCDT